MRKTEKCEKVKLTTAAPRESDELWEFDGQQISTAECWDVEFKPDEQSWAQALAFVDGNLCHACTIVQSDDGEFFSVWTEQHPHMPDDEAFFASSGRTAQRVAEYNALLERFPSTSYGIRLSRAEAYEALARLWLPREFHADAGFAWAKAENAKADLDAALEEAPPAVARALSVVTEWLDREVAKLRCIGDRPAPSFRIV